MSYVKNMIAAAVVRQTTGLCEGMLSDNFTCILSYQHSFSRSQGGSANPLSNSSSTLTVMCNSFVCESSAQRQGQKSYITCPALTRRALARLALARLPHSHLHACATKPQTLHQTCLQCNVPSTYSMHTIKFRTKVCRTPIGSPTSRKHAR